ncbi:hypothetical protein [Bosea sp. 124]|uniref:hypothetical protein n=1 Tax=Bosea sp. 124 TaxID=2135642 RepID=UPI000D372E1F|nr:hypothetical protein [Bosea sp. 124]PTM42883.1 hypothetical protein C8D03_4483 [Bosea sp. 124]
MQLGVLLTRLSDESDAAVALDALGDLVLLAEIQAMGEQHDETPGEYVANASRRYAAQAGDEDWLALMTAIERADDPGRVVLGKMLRWALARDAAPAPAAGGCACGSGGCDEHR